MARHEEKGIKSNDTRERRSMIAVRQSKDERS